MIDNMENNFEDMLVATVLLVDDDSLLRNLFTKRLVHAGYVVHNAADGVSGLEMAEHIQPNVILVDYHMPKRNGDTMLALLRETEWGQAIPVIFMTAINSLDDVNNLHQANKVMHKPITNTELLTAIEEVLNSRE